MENAAVVRDRISRMRWWTEARYGMFIHWGLYAQLGRGEWVMNRERIPRDEYEKLADTWKPKPRPAREWAALAKKAGMKYMVMTTKHHEGFCLWDSKVTDYCAGQRGPRRDLVKEFVEACREYGLKIGFYYSLMDWHHPDGHACEHDEAARRRFLDYTQGLVRELMTRYGRIDILWYDVSWPLQPAERWESHKMNAMVRRLQPRILINDRSQLPEDFGTPEEHITAGSSAGGRGWEACMTFNESWGWQDAPPEDWHSTRKILDMLRTCAAGAGNLLLNIGPLPDGSVPPIAVRRLGEGGRWLKRYGEAVYGKVDPVARMEFNNNCRWSRKGRTIYAWVMRWPGDTFTIGGVRGKLKAASLVAGGRKLSFMQGRDRVILTGLPKTCPDKIAGVSLIRLEFAGVPYQQLSCSYEYVKPVPPAVSSPFVDNWRLSPVLPKRAGGIASVRYEKPRYDEWRIGQIDVSGFLNVHDRTGDRDGVVCLAKRFSLRKAGTWGLAVGHDGGVRVFVDRKPVLTEAVCVNPALPGRSRVNVALSRGVHEVVVALDLAGGKGWGIFFQWEKPRGAGKKMDYPAEAD